MNVKVAPQPESVTVGSREGPSITVSHAIRPVMNEFDNNTGIQIMRPNAINGISGGAIYQFKDAVKSGL